MKCSSGWRNDDFVGDREFGPALHKFLPMIFLKPSAKRSKRLANALYCAKCLVKSMSMKLKLILLALGNAVTVCTVTAQNTGTEENLVKSLVPTTSLVVAKITSQDAGFDRQNNHLINALYVSGTFTNTNTSAINLHSYHVTGLDANGKQVANSECDKSGGEFTGSLAPGETTNFRAELIDVKKEIRLLKVDLN